jgi:CO/xanthine dehydrogenase Mo-binding subunit
MNVVDNRFRASTGGARYTADISCQSAVRAAIVHGTIANGRTVSINTTAAERVRGVPAVLSGG